MAGSRPLSDCDRQRALNTEAARSTGYVGYELQAFDEERAEWITLDRGIQSRELAIDRAKIPHQERRRVRNEKGTIVYETGDEA